MTSPRTSSIWCWPRFPARPEGVKGISLFIVPKFLVNPDGSLGDRNAVSCGSIEEKMGIHGNSTCVMNYDGAVGYLIGEEHKGLRTMFIMMNAARLGVGGAGRQPGRSGLSERRRLLQGAAPGPFAAWREVPRRDGGSDHRPSRHPPDADDGRVFQEGARALACWAGLQVDIIRKHPDAEDAAQGRGSAGPADPGDEGLFHRHGLYIAANLCLQCFGGHGYIAEWGMEQFVRDARIAQIYEGANGIQALDLIGRKLPANKGRAIQFFFALIGGFCEKYEDNAALSPFVKPLTEALERLVEATQWLMQHAISNPDNGGAVSMDYLYMMALVTLGYQWAQVARICENQLSNPDDDSFDRAFYQNKLVCAEFFMEKVLPETMAHLAKIQAGADSLMTLRAEAF